MGDDKLQPEWFNHPSRLHGIEHTQRVTANVEEILAGLDGEVDPETAEAARLAARWHDIGRVHDEVDPEHGALSAERAQRLGLTASVPPVQLERALFAVRFHSRHDGDARAATHDAELLTTLWILKDADGLDRTRLGDLDVRYLRYPCSVAIARARSAPRATATDDPSVN